MRQLLLLRHAKSSWSDSSLSDHARPLNARGRRAAAAMRRAMRDLGLAPDIVLVSSARRTLQTLDELEPWDDTPLIEPMDGLYLATSAQMLKILHGVAETARSVLLIGHNPGIHDLAVTLAGPIEGRDDAKLTRLVADGFPTATLAEFTVANSWPTLGESGGVRLVRYLRPSDLQG